MAAGAVRVLAFHPSPHIAVGRHRGCRSRSQTSCCPPDGQAAGIGPRVPRAVLHVDAVVSDLVVTVAAASFASVGVYTLQRSVQAGFLDSKVNRKLVHTLSGPLLLVRSDPLPCFRPLSGQ